MPATVKTSLKVTYHDSLGQSKSQSYANVNPSVTDAQAQAFATAFDANADNILPGGYADMVKMEKISTTTEEIPLS